MRRVRDRLLSRSMLGNLVVLGLLGGWYLMLSPTTLGGPTAYIEVSGHSMDGTYRTGDLVITREQDTYRRGDIVTFRAQGGQVIHRIIGGNGTEGYTLQGDNNPDPDPWHPTDADVVGKAWIHLPQKAHLLRLPADPKFAGSAAGFVTALILLVDAAKESWVRRRGSRHDADESQPVGAGTGTAR
jgi:signal peptidase